MTSVLDLKQHLIVLLSLSVPSLTDLFCKESSKCPGNSSPNNTEVTGSKFSQEKTALLKKKTN